MRSAQVTVKVEPGVRSTCGPTRVAPPMPQGGVLRLASKSSRDGGLVSFECARAEVGPQSAATSATAPATVMTRRLPRTFMSPPRTHSPAAPPTEGQGAQWRYPYRTPNAHAIGPGTRCYAAATV